MLAEESKSFLETLLAGSACRRSPWLSSLSSAALERAKRRALPSTRDESWRFTDLTPLYRSTVRPPASAGSVDLGPFLAGTSIDGVAARLVFIDGFFSEAHSDLPAGGGLTVARLAEAAEEKRSLVEPLLGSLADDGDDLFAAVNTAWLCDGVVVHARRQTVLREPIHCVFVTTQGAVVVHPRVLVLAEGGSELLVIEDYAATHGGVYWVNAVCEIFVRDNARVRHVRLQRDSGMAFHLGTTAVSVGRNGFYSSNAVSLGARISRHNLNIRQDGPGATLELDGLAMIGGRQHADTHSFVDHAFPDGSSRQLHKCVVSGGAHSVFNGRILVRPGSQRTDSAQQSRNLLMSARARVDAKPQLEIFADDVKCAHGATVGQLEEDEVFYLRSRGMTEELARGLLSYGFAAEVVNRIPVSSVVAGLRQAIIDHTGASGIG